MAPAALSLQGAQLDTSTDIPQIVIDTATFIRAKGSLVRRLYSLKFVFW